MDTTSDKRQLMRTPDLLAVGALGLAVVASLAGILATGLYRDNPEAIRQARATDLVTVLLGVPALGLGLWQARAGSAWGRAVAVGALGYLAYSYAIYAFSVVINAMTPIHIAILGLATWSLVLVPTRLDVGVLANASPIRLPRRSTGLFLVTVGAMFGLLWLSQIAGAISSGVLPPSISDLALPTSPVYALDLAFALPLLLLAGAWLMRSDIRGPFAAAAALAFVIVMGASVLAIFVVDGAAGVALEAPPVVIFGLVTGIGVALLGIGIRGTQQARPLRLGILGA